MPVLLPFAASAAVESTEWPHCDDDDVGAARTGASCAKSPDEQHADREVSDATDDDDDDDVGGWESSAAATAEEGPIMLPSFRSFVSVGRSLGLLLFCANSPTRVSRWLNFRGCAASRGFCSLSFSLGRPLQINSNANDAVGGPGLTMVGDCMEKFSMRRRVRPRENQTISAVGREAREARNTR